MANIIANGFIITLNKRDNIFYSELREYVQANYPDISFKNAKVYLVSIGAREFKDNSIRGLKYIKFAGNNMLGNSKLNITMADSTNILKQIPHAGLKTITKELNLHTIIRVSKLTREQLIQKLASMTKIKDGKLVVSIPETELAIPSAKKAKAKATPTKRAEISSEVASQIQMSIPKLINGLAKINELKDSSTEKLPKSQSDSLLAKKVELANEVLTDTEEIVNKLNKKSDITAVQNDIASIAINYINESPGINLAQSEQIDNLVLDNISDILEQITPGLVPLTLDSTTLDKIDTSTLPAESNIVVPRELISQSEPAQVSSLFGAIDFDSMNNDFSISNLDDELRLYEESQANYVPNVKVQKEEEQENEYNPDVPKTKEERDAKLAMLRARARQASGIAQVPVVVKPVRKLTSNEQVADYNTLDNELRKLLEGKPVRQLANSVESDFLTFIPRDVINLIQNKAILRDLLQKTKNFIKELEPGPDDKVIQLAKGMLSSIESNLYPVAKLPKGRPKAGTGLQDIEADIRAFISTLSPEKRKLADDYINPGIQALKSAINDYIVYDAPELNYAKLEPLASKPDLAVPEAGKTTLAKFTYTRDNKYYNAIRNKLDNALDERILSNGDFSLEDISTVNDLVINYLFKDEIQLANYTIADIIKDKELQGRIARARAGYFANAPLSREGQAIMDNFAKDIQGAIRTYISKNKTRRLKLEQSNSPAQLVKSTRLAEFNTALADSNPDEVLKIDYVKLLDKVPYSEINDKLDTYITDNRIKTQLKNRILRKLASANQQVLNDAEQTYLRILRNDKAELRKVGAGYTSWARVILDSGNIRYADSGPMAILYNIRKDYRKAKSANNTEKMAQLVDKYISIAYKDKINAMLRANYPTYDLSNLNQSS